jgi:transcriptional regulator
MKEAKRTQITEQICKQAQLMRKGGANQTEIGKLLGVNPCTISRIEAAGFDLGTYTKMMKERR